MISVFVRNLFRSFSSRILGLSIGLVALSAIVVGTLQYRNGIDIRRTQFVTQMDRAMRDSDLELNAFVKNASTVVLALRSSPAVQGIIRSRYGNFVDPIDGTVERSWRDRLGRTFAGYMQANPDIMKMRFMTLAQNGLEIVRVERLADRVVVAADLDLQYNGQVDYVKRTLASRNGAIILSKIDLNREFGEIPDLHVPVLRVATPVYDTSGRIFGLIVINQDMRPFLSRLETSAPAGADVYLTNASGDFLKHPDPNRNFGFDLGRRWQIQAQMPDLAPFLRDGAGRDFSYEYRTDFDTHIVQAHKIRLGSGDGANDIVLILDQVFRFSDMLNNSGLSQVLLATLGLSAIGLLLAWLTTRMITRPLEELTAAAGGIAENRPIEQIDLPVGRVDEIGVLARAVATMGRAVEARQAQVKSREAELEAILETAPNPILTVDKEGTIVSVNAATKRLFGFGHEELLGRNVSVLLLAKDAERHDFYMQNYDIAREDVGFERDVQAMRKDGTPVPVRVAVNKVILQDKLHFTAVLTDLTESLQFDELKKIDKLKSEFVATVSHELRTPLTSIKGSLALINGDALGHVPDKVQQMVGIAHKNCDRLVRLINDILDVEKIEAGELAFEMKKVNVSELLRNAIDANAAYTAEQGARVSLHEVDADACVEGDIDRLTQVLTNLLSNAAKFSPADGKIVVRSELMPTGCHRISVADQGPGIPEEHRDRIFGKFAQVNSSDSREKGGTGLGLAICKAIVEAHSGKIGFDCTPGQGTTFWVAIPLFSEIRTDRPKGGAQILICEDDRDIATLLAMAVEQIGMAPVVCADAEQAMERLKAGGIAAMTLDVGLPGKSGTRLLRDIQTLPEFADLPVVMVSGQARDRHNEAVGDGLDAHAWFEKPIDLENLKACLIEAVENLQQKRPKILCIEDDRTHSAIVQSLVETHVTPYFATSCAEARALLGARDFDLVILDLDLPDGSGESLIPQIVNNGRTPPRILVYSISELDGDLRDVVDCAFVKSKVGLSALRNTIDRLLEERMSGLDIPRASAAPITYGTGPVSRNAAQ